MEKEIEQTNQEKINNFLREVIYADWMDENDYKEAVELVFEMQNSSVEKFSNDIEIGIKNGYSIDTQLAFCRGMIENENKKSKSNGFL